jgi:hypothetical protein
MSCPHQLSFKEAGLLSPTLDGTAKDRAPRLCRATNRPGVWAPGRGRFIPPSLVPAKLQPGCWPSWRCPHRHSRKRPARLRPPDAPCMDGCLRGLVQAPVLSRCSQPDDDTLFSTRIIWAMFQNSTTAQGSESGTLVRSVVLRLAQGGQRGARSRTSPKPRPCVKCR